MSIRVSHLIPLYRSARFHDVIVENIGRLCDDQDEIIVSDRNGDQSYCEHLRRLFSNRENFKVFCENDDASWVVNIAEMVGAAQGRFLRILPHDDSTDAAAVELLVKALDHDPSASVAFGQVQAFDLDGRHLPHLDQLNLVEKSVSSRWVLGDVLPIFWTGRFGGAFKGMIRSSIAKRDALRFRATPGLAHSERAWLFALGLTGPFRFVPAVVLNKRYYPESTHMGWPKTPDSITDAANLMVDYARELLTEKTVADYAVMDIALNAERYANAVQAGQSWSFYHPAIAPHAARLRSHPLPGHRGADA